VLWDKLPDRVKPRRPDAADTSTGSAAKSISDE
jgi:hypothetical protein